VQRPSLHGHADRRVAFVTSLLSIVTSTSLHSYIAIVHRHIIIVYRRMDIVDRRIDTVA